MTPALLLKCIVGVIVLVFLAVLTDMLLTRRAEKRRRNAMRAMVASGCLSINEARSMRGRNG